MLAEKNRWLKNERNHCNQLFVQGKKKIICWEVNGESGRLLSRKGPDQVVGVGKNDDLKGVRPGKGEEVTLRTMK